MSINDISSRKPDDIDLADAFRHAQRNVDRDESIPAVSRLVTEVSDLSRKSEQAIGLLGEIVATFSLSKNRELLSEHESGKLILEIADQWVRRFQKIVGPVCTGVSANWCPIHGNCTCKDRDDKNDDDCPLHSAASTHAEAIE